MLAMNASTFEDLLGTNWTESDNSTVGMNTSRGRPFNWRTPGPMKWYTIIHITFLLIVLVFAIVNILVLWIMLRTKHLRTPFNTIVSAMLAVNIVRSLITTVMDIAEIHWYFNIQSPVYCIVKTLIKMYAYNFVLVLMVAIALLRAYVCIRTSVVKLQAMTIRIVLAMGSLLACSMIVGNLFPSSVTQKICLARFPFVGDSSLKYFPMIKAALIVLLNIMVFMSYALIAYFIKTKRRNFKVAKNDIFTLKAGVGLSLLFGLTYMAPYFGSILAVIPGTRKDLLLLLNIIRFFSNLTYLDTIVMPLMFLSQNARLRKQMFAIVLKSANFGSTVVPMSTMVSATQQ